MLILTRRPSEDIIIRDANGLEITVKLVSITGNQARLGITAPKEISVHRREIQERIDQERGE